MREIITELRGNGVVVSVFETDGQVIDQLALRALQMGEELHEAWFDPFFWHPKEIQQLKSHIRKSQEYRGLKSDNMSFVEIRRKGKRRKKYLLKELLGDGQLFPMVDIVEGSLNPCSTKSEVIEFVEATGSIAVYRCPFNELFNLNEMRLTKISSSVGTYFLFSLATSNRFHLERDDFLVRRQFGLFPLKSNNY